MARKINRLQFISLLQTSLRDVVARKAIEGQRLASVVFDDRYDLQNRQDVGVLLNRIDEYIDNELAQDSYNNVQEKVITMSNVGGMHGLQEVAKIVGNTAIMNLEFTDQLALDYLGRVGLDGKRLSDRVWDNKDKDSIYKEVFNAVREGKSTYDLGRAIEQVVAEGTPMKRIKAIAETELTYAYSHAKTDIVMEEANLFDNVEAYVRVRLSPAHPKPDICDLMAGTYPADKAPLPPYHPHCLCEVETILRPKRRPMKTTTIEKQLNKNPDLVTVPRVETIDRTISL